MSIGSGGDDFDNSDKEREGRPAKYEDVEFEALLDQDSCQTQKSSLKSWE